MKKALRVLAAICVAIPVIQFGIILIAGGGQSQILIGWASSGMGAVVATILRAKRTSGQTRKKWFYVASAFFLWSLGNVIMVWTERDSPCAFGCYANVDDFIFMLATIPLLLVVAMPNEEDAESVSSWLEIIPAVALVFLSFVGLFSVFPWSPPPYRAISNGAVTTVYLVSLLYFSISFAARLIAEPPGENKNLIKLLCISLSAHMADQLLINLPLVRSDRAGAASPWLVLEHLPVLSLTLWASLSPLGSRPAPDSQGAKYNRVIGRVSRALLSFGAICAALWVSKLFPLTGILSVLVIVGSYDVRIALQQVEEAREFRKLQTKLRSYERVAIVDPQTGLPNRNALIDRLATIGMEDRTDRVALVLLGWSQGEERNEEDEESQDVSLFGEMILQYSAKYQPWIARYSSRNFALLFRVQSEQALLDISAELARNITDAIGYYHDGIVIHAGASFLNHAMTDDADAVLNRADRALSTAMSRKEAVVVARISEGLMRVK